MTRAKWAKLSPKEQNRLVLKYANPGHDYTTGVQVPLDYINDLNAMNEAEAELKDAAIWEEYAFNLFFIVMKSDNSAVGKIDDPHISATAVQRAEAFVLTMYKEDA